MSLASASAMGATAFAVESTQQYLLVLGRSAGLFFLSPLSRDVLPVRIRVTALLLTSFALTGAARPAPNGDFVIHFVWELLAGSIAALMARLPFWAAEAGLEAASVSVGLGISTLLNPGAQEEVHSLTELLGMAALLVFFATGTHHQLIRTLAESLLLIPLGTLRLSHDAAMMILSLAAEYFRIMLVVAAPLFLVTLALNLFLALVSRAAPALNLFAVSLSAVVIVGLLVVLQVLPSLILLFAGVADQSTLAFRRMLLP